MTILQENQSPERSRISISSQGTTGNQQAKLQNAASFCSVGKRSCVADYHDCTLCF